MRMKYVLIVGDGMADYPIDALNGKTPLEVADKPHLDALTAEGRSGLLKTIPEGMEPGSSVANLSILGYDPKKWYTGRGPIEAASMGIRLEENDIVFRCNLITEENGKLVDYSADHITSEEAKELIDSVKEHFEKPDEIDFCAGVSYRHLLVLRNSPDADEILCTPPHDVVGAKISEILPKTKRPNAEATADLLHKMILDSKPFLEYHRVNARRVAQGKRPGNMIWPWGQGKKMKLPTLKEKFGLKGAVISAVDLIRGIGICAGLDVINVPGATGYFDTNYESKADYALKALENHDLVFIHVEAPDEAGHSGDYKQKIRCIEDLDKRLIGKIMNGLPQQNCALAVLPDHATPIRVRTHTNDPVPFTIKSPLIKPDGVKCFNEASARKGGFGLLEKGEIFMPLFLGIT
jgi:2,3-bisphosphoglycerate-independent phosphoglycerate mutase